MARIVMHKGNKSVTIEICQTMEIAKAKARYYGTLNNRWISFKAEYC